jgi:hypothetical protein
MLPVIKFTARNAKYSKNIQNEYEISNIQFRDYFSFINVSVICQYSLNMELQCSRHTEFYWVTEFLKFLQ